MFSSKSRKKRVLSAKLYITDRTDRLSAEIKSNMFCMGGTERDIAELSESDILTFLKEIRENRHRQLEASGKDVDLIYYLWYDALAGQLRFNFINSNHPALPFGCKLNIVEDESFIVGEFKADAKGGIPLAECESFTIGDDGDDDGNEDLRNAQKESSAAAAFGVDVVEPLSFEALEADDDGRECILNVYTERIARGNA